MYTIIYTLWISLWKRVRIRGQSRFVYNIVYKKCTQQKINFAKISKYFLSNKNIRLKLDKNPKIWYSIYVDHYNAVVLPTSFLSGRPPSLLLYFARLPLVSKNNSFIWVTKQSFRRLSLFRDSLQGYHQK